MKVKEVTDLLNSRTIQFIIGTVCILVVANRLEHLFQMDESRTLEEPKKYRQRVGQMTERGAKIIAAQH